MSQKLILGAGFMVVTPAGMVVGIFVLNHFNGNDPATIMAIGSLDAFSAGILVWVGLVEMLAGDWMAGGELASADATTATLALSGLVSGVAAMNFLGRWA